MSQDLTIYSWRKIIQLASQQKQFKNHADDALSDMG